jgi:hypothetical protein
MAGAPALLGRPVRVGESNDRMKTRMDALRLEVVKP